MDLISITRSMYSHEIEIKINKHDFLADKKKHKHQIIKNQIRFHNYLRTSNYFWYCCPKGLVRKKEVVDYAGLITIDSNKKIEIIKKPYRLHKNKITVDEFNRLAFSMMYRFWRKNDHAY